MMLSRPVSLKPLFLALICICIAQFITSYNCRAINEKVNEMNSMLTQIQSMIGDE